MEFESFFDWNSSDSEEEDDGNLVVDEESNKKFSSWSRPCVNWSKFGEDIDFMVLDADFRSQTAIAPDDDRWFFRLHGVTQSGSSCCCNVFNFQPFFYVIYPEFTFLNDTDFTNLHRFLSHEVTKTLATSKSLVVRNRLNKKDPIVSTVEIDATKVDKKMLGEYNNVVGMLSGPESTGHQIIKITCLCPRVVRAARKIVCSGSFQSQFNLSSGISSEHFIIDDRYLICQWLSDLKLSGSPWLRISNGRYIQRAISRKSVYAQIEVDVSFELLQTLPDRTTIPILRILSFDIEVLTTPPLFEFPLMASKPVLQIGNVIANSNAPKGFEPLRVIFTLKSCDPIPGVEIYSYEKEIDLLNAWGKFVLYSDPDILTGYNIHQFDLPYLFRRADRIGATSLMFAGRVKNVRAVQHQIAKKLNAVSDYSNKRIMIAGRIVLDMMLIVMKHNNIPHSKNRLQLQADGEFSLGAVANRYLQSSKIDIKHTEIWELQAKGPKTRKKLAIYCLHDSLLPYLLLLGLKIPEQDLYAQNVLSHYISKSSSTKIPLKYLFPISRDPTWFINQPNSKTSFVAKRTENIKHDYKKCYALIDEKICDLYNIISILLRELETAESSAFVLTNKITFVTEENSQLECRVQELIIHLNRAKQLKPKYFTNKDKICDKKEIKCQLSKVNDQGRFIPTETGLNKTSKNLTLHQVNGVKFLLNTVMSEETNGTGAILGCAVGSGKSAIVLKFWQEITAPNFGMLILCTKNGVENWKSEINEWLTSEERDNFFCINTRKCDLNGIAQKWSTCGGILLSTYKMFLQILQYTKFEAPVSQINQMFFNPGPAVVVLDEGHVIKNTCTNIYEAINMISTKRKIIVSGTVIQNSLEDVFSLTSVVKPGCLNSKKIFTYRWEKAFDLGLISPFSSKYNFKRATKLREVISSIFYNSTLGTLLPDQKDWILHLRPSPIQKALLNSLLKMIYSGNGFQEKHSHSVFEVESLISRILSHPDILLWNNDKSAKNSKLTWAADILKQYSPGNLKNGVKLEVLFEIFKDAAELSCKVLVYSKYLETLDTIELFLSQHQDKRHKYIRVDGTTSSKARQNIYNQINKKGGPFILLISTGSGSDAVNLHGASITVIMDVNWNPGVDTQCQGRTRRYTHNNNSVVYRLVVEGTFDSLKLQHQSFKQNIVGQVMGVLGTGRDNERTNSFDFLQFEPKSEHGSSFGNQHQLPDQIVRITQNLMTGFAKQVATPYYESSANT